MLALADYGPNNHILALDDYIPNHHMLALADYIPNYHMLVLDDYIPTSPLTCAQVSLVACFSGQSRDRAILSTLIAETCFG